MLVDGTQMHIVTLLFICLEILILFFLIIQRLARPDNKIAFLNIILISLLIVYNLTGGLLPDPGLPGSYFVQNAIAYGTGFITPCFFPYYVYRGFELEKMRFHAYKGVLFFLVIPYMIFILVFGLTGDLNAAKDILILPVLYAIWVIVSLAQAIEHKNRNNQDNKESVDEIIVLFLSITPWVGLPIIDYYNMGQATEATITNLGFLLLFSFQLMRHIKQTRKEQEMLRNSESYLQSEIERRTKERLAKTLSNLSNYALERKDVPPVDRFDENCRRYKLSEREKEIAALIRIGKTYKEIGAQLFISERTVTTHVRNIYEKLEVSNKIEMIKKLEANQSH